ncbi:hypothetical protein BU23DRAFT_572963 [Bimuria novae-zelandiae CBS 107.79]|uniref:Uncharacterized protein n=1 Tax=Bimuria novae-zelandiae CBS 107.79 TaxID=1447943 RepID=A0A6A5UXP0_9PLEO|nr:hypothetical protein BU23DRAFT_572963 [Bimuria novae-zelandiae CBS 107.79]
MARIFRSLHAWGRRVRAAFHRAMEKHFTIRSHAEKVEHSSDTIQNDVLGSSRIHAAKVEHSSDTIQSDVLGSSRVQAARPSLAQTLEYRNYQNRLRQRRKWSKATNGISRIYHRPSMTDYSDSAAGAALSSAGIVGSQKIQNDKPRRNRPRNGISKSKYRK